MHAAVGGCLGSRDHVLYICHPTITQRLIQFMVSWPDGDWDTILGDDCRFAQPKSGPADWHSDWAGSGTAASDGTMAHATQLCRAQDNL